VGFHLDDNWLFHGKPVTTPAHSYVGKSTSPKEKGKDVEVQMGIRRGRKIEESQRSSKGGCGKTRLSRISDEAGVAGRISFRPRLPKN
jgi:hypothetical protein